MQYLYIKKNYLPKTAELTIIMQLFWLVFVLEMNK